jgi:5-methylcytosine-specific restriction endonuclease McrA/endogenous inhibitor of DNA gyrase (YacG/DUF329 family)
MAETQEKVCSISECASKVLARGWCRSHYRRWSKYGDPLGSKVHPERPCAHCGTLHRREARAVYCSSRCQVIASSTATRARRKEERATLRTGRPCGVCGEEISRERPGQTLYCSHECWRAKNFPKVDTTGRACAECAADISALPATTKYCSQGCALKHRYWGDRDRSAPLYTPDCAHCGTPFSSSTLLAKYCSRSCGSSSWRARNPEANSWHRRKANHTRRTRLREGGVFSVTPGDWARLVRRYGECCAYCGVWVGLDEIEMDHVTPVARGGRHSIGNLLPACRSCNGSKNDQLLIAWKMRRI